MRSDLSNIIGISRIAPAGEKYIFNLSSAINKIIHASAVHIKSGKPQISFNNNLKAHPTNDAKVIRATI